MYRLHRRALRRVPQLLLLLLRRRRQARRRTGEGRRRGASGIPSHPFPIRRRIAPARRICLLHRRALLERLLAVKVHRVILRRLLLLLLLLLLTLIRHPVRTGVSAVIVFRQLSHAMAIDTKLDSPLLLLLLLPTLALRLLMLLEPLLSLRLRLSLGLRLSLSLSLRLRLLRLLVRMHHLHLLLLMLHHHLLLLLLGRRRSSRSAGRATRPRIRIRRGHCRPLIMVQARAVLLNEPLLQSAPIRITSTVHSEFGQPLTRSSSDIAPTSRLAKPKACAEECMTCGLICPRPSDEYIWFAATCICWFCIACSCSRDTAGPFGPCGMGMCIGVGCCCGPPPPI